MYSTRILDYTSASSSSTSRNFRTELDSEGSLPLDSPIRSGQRAMLIGKKYERLPNNRICTIRPFYQQLPYVLLRIMTRQHVLYLFLASLLTCIVREEEYLPMNIGLLLLLVVVYTVRVGWTVARFQNYDRKENEQPVVELLSEENETEKSRQELVVGSIIRVDPEQEFPADVLPLFCENGPRIRISTVSLDKERVAVTRLISNKIANKLASQTHLFWKLRGVELFYERPNSSFYSFEGKLTEKEKNGYELLTHQHLILRGSQLKEDRPVICVVLYTGNECKKFASLSDRRNATTRLTLLHRELEEEIPAMLILASTLVLIGVIVYICQYTTKLNGTDQKGLSFFNRYFFFLLILEFACYLNVLHVWVFLMLEIARWLQLRSYQQKEPTVVNNMCQSIDQFGRARTVIADELTLFGIPEFSYKEGENLVSPNPELAVSTLRSILLTSPLFHEMYAQEAEAIEKWYRIEGKIKEEGLLIRKETLSPDNKALYIVVEVERNKHFLVKVVNQKDLYYSPSSDESQLMEPITERIRDEKRAGSRILALLTKQLEDYELELEPGVLTRQVSEYSVTSEVNISSMGGVDHSLITRYQNQLKFVCVMVFCYSISKDISQFAELLRNNDTQLWIVTERPIVSVDEILTSAGVQDYTTNRLIIDRLDTNELKDHLKYVDGLLDKNQSQRLQSVLYVSCDSLYAFSKAEVEHLHHISRKCLAVVCFNYNNFLRERLQDCFTNSTEGVVFLSQFLVENNLMLQADVSVSLVTESSPRQAKVVDFEVESVMDLGRLMCHTGRLAYRRNCQLSYCLIFGNSLLVGCQIFVSYIGIPFNPIILHYQYSVDLFNILILSLPLIAYSTAVGGNNSEDTPETRYSSWAVWRLVLTATLIGMLTTSINMSWIMASTTVFDLKVSSLINCVLLGNLFIGLAVLAEPIAPLRKLVIWSLILLDLGLYCLWMSIADSIDSSDWYTLAELVSKSRFFTIPCLLISNAFGGLLCWTYLQMWPLANRQNRRITETKQARSTELQCRLAIGCKGRIIHLAD